MSTIREVFARFAVRLRSLWSKKPPSFDSRSGVVRQMLGHAAQRFERHERIDLRTNGSAVVQCVYDLKCMLEMDRFFHDVSAVRRIASSCYFMEAVCRLSPETTNISDPDCDQIRRVYLESLRLAVVEGYVSCEMLEDMLLGKSGNVEGNQRTAIPSYASTLARAGNVSKEHADVFAELLALIAFTRSLDSDYDVEISRFSQKLTADKGYGETHRNDFCSVIRSGGTRTCDLVDSLESLGLIPSSGIADDAGGTTEVYTVLDQLDALLEAENSEALNAAWEHELSEYATQPHESVSVSVGGLYDPAHAPLSSASSTETIYSPAWDEGLTRDQPASDRILALWNYGNQQVADGYVCDGTAGQVATGVTQGVGGRDFGAGSAVEDVLTGELPDADASSEPPPLEPYHYPEEVEEILRWKVWSPRYHVIPVPPRDEGRAPAYVAAA